ncbi:MAG: Na(+)/H(+) antiporter NhaA [Phycisphaeraceae bacterium]|nr:MAG: Na(+)/H(+) antiporter NhaA [Phycisphaeraceae bacterium]
MAVHGVHIPTATEELKPDTGERLTRPFARFAALSSSGGLVLLACTIAALIWANASDEAAHSYHHLFHEVMLAIGITDGVGFTKNLHWWINDGLMAVFFLLVGLEIKRELLVGELASIKKASLPIVAAIGGMVAPALIYAAFNFGNESIHGWGIPMATDIAFALGILALLGPRVPTSLKVFLTSLAIADDLGALLVIAIFYTENLQTVYLMYSGAVMALLFALNLMGFRRAIWYLIPGVVLWYFIYSSGVHATIAGVLLAATIPVASRVDSRRYLSYSRAALDAFEEHSVPGRDVKTNSDQRAAVYAIEKNNKFLMPLLHRMEGGIHPWAAFFIIPIFALANAGVHVHGGIGQAASGPISMGIILGLFVGKPVGIIVSCYIATKLKIASLPTGVSWRHILGVGFLAGIGFTMALFIANLAFANNDDNLEHAKVGILLASFLSSIVGLGILLTCKPKPEPEPDELGPEIDSH